MYYIYKRIGSNLKKTLPMVSLTITKDQLSFINDRHIWMQNTCASKCGIGNNCTLILLSVRILKVCKDSYQNDLHQQWPFGAQPLYSNTHRVSAVQKAHGPHASMQ